MEAYLDWQKKTSGIKLNDVIEEYRYVANGKTVKKGDFLTYVGEDVAPAIQPPFNAVALSSGVGGPEFVEEAKIGNIFPTSGWSQVVDKTKYSSNGYILEASSTNSNSYLALYACDGDSADKSWISGKGLEHWLKMTCPQPTKISKMKTYIKLGSNNSAFHGAIIQGSFNDSEWVDLAQITSQQSSFKEISLNNVDCYNYYRILANVSSTATPGDGSTIRVYEWQVSEYIEQIPSTEHNQQVKIARLPIEIKKTGNIFPISGWNEEIAPTKYSTNDGFILEASSASANYPVYYMCNGSAESLSLWSTKAGASQWAIMTMPRPVKITKMISYVDGGFINGITIQGSKNGLEWTDLYTATSKQIGMTEFALTNTDFYTQYKLYVTLSNPEYAISVYEWQTSEYVEEVI